jgi:hypothetical protein
MSFEKIHIATPCIENLGNMKPCEGGYFCGVCEKKVIDLRKKTAVEVDDFAQKNDACVLVAARHTTRATKTEKWLANTEGFLIGKRMRFISVALISASIFLAGCRPRKKQVVYKGMWRRSAETINKSNDAL